MKVFCLHNNTGSRYYRLIPQLKEMQKRGHQVIFESHDTKNVLQKIEWADLVIFEMIFGFHLIDYVKKKGKKVIFECDDLIHIVPKGHYAYKETEGWKKIRWFWRIWRVLRKCDGFITTVPLLNKMYGWMAKKSLVFPNYCDLEHWLKEYHPNTTDRIRLLWAGSKSHKPDLLWIKPVLKRILKKYPQVQFIYSGIAGTKSTDLQAQFIYGKDFFDDLPENREPILPAPANIWPYILASLQADIAIAPLCKNIFNNCRSQCKYLEYSINRIPAVYSTHHFSSCVKQGKTGFLADNYKEWEKYLTLLIKNSKIRKKIGKNAFDDVIENYDIRKHIDRWCEFVENI